MKLFRNWVTLPLYSKLVVNVNLSGYETQKERVNCKVELGCEESINANAIDVGDGIIMLVEVHPFSPHPSVPAIFYAEEYLEYEAAQSSVTKQVHDEYRDPHEEATESSAMEIDDVCSPSSLSSRGKRKVTEIHDEVDDKFDGEPASKDMGTANPGCSVARHKPIPDELERPIQTHVAMEIFSIFIGQKILEPLQIYGSVLVSLDGSSKTIYTNVKETPLMLDENLKFLPKCKESIPLKSSASFEAMKIDLRDIEGRVAIKGYVHLSCEFLHSYGFERQISSVIHGDKGFAAVHYSIYVQAKIIVNLSRTMNNHNIHGKIFARYHGYDYSSRYEREHYRIELFSRSEDDAVSIADEESQLSLSRDVIAVPIDVGLILDVELNPEEFAHSSKRIAFGLNDKKSWNAGACHVTFGIEWSPLSKL